MSAHMTREEFAARAELLLGVPPDVVEALYPMVNDVYDLIAVVNRFNLRLGESFDESDLSETMSGDA